MPARRGVTQQGGLRKGDRVQLHAATSEWMQGDRYGTVTGFGALRTYMDSETGGTVAARPVLVKLDKSGRTKRLHPDNVYLANPGKSDALTERDVSVTRLHNGAWEVAAIVGNQRRHKTYYQYTKREAVRDFLEEVNEVRVNPPGSSPRFYNEKDDWQWLLDTLLRNAEHGHFQSYIIYGNDDYPERVALFSKKEPFITDSPSEVWEPGIDGWENPMRANG